MKFISRTILVAGLMIFGPMAQADVISFFIDGENDCGTYYQTGRGFDSCVIFSEGEDSTEISSVIAKWDDDEQYWEVSGFYDGFDPDDMTLNINGQSGDWDYDSDAVGIRFWVVKHGDAFTVYYDAEDDTCTNATAWTTACMTTALVVNAGDWNTSDNNRNGLSHISFYDSEVKVPEPGTLALFGLGLLGIGAARRRRVS